MTSSYKCYVKVTDPETQESFKQLIEVNEPLRYKGVTIYQSGFDDGGSQLNLQMYPLRGGDYTPRAVSAEVGNSQSVTMDCLPASPTLPIQPTELRVLNVAGLSMGVPQPNGGTAHQA